MNLPTSLMTSLHNVTGFDKESFERIHQSGEQVTAIRINPAKWSAVDVSESLDHLGIKDKVAWSSFGYYLAERPSFTLDPFFSCWLLLCTGRIEHVCGTGIQTNC